MRSTVILGDEIVTFASRSGAQAFQTNAATVLAGASVLKRLGDNLTAVGDSQATALQLDAAINRVADAAAAEAGVNLPAGAPGAVIVVINDAGHPIITYPIRDGDDPINGFDAKEGLLLPKGTVGTFFYTDNGWLGVLASVTAVNQRVEDQIAELNLRLDRIERLIVSPPA
jgi:hypothetical protein